MIWVLMIVTYVNGGAHVFSQEFTTQERCETARHHVEASSQWRVLYAKCLPK